MDLPLDNPDLAARRVIMSAYLYYRHDAPVLSDADYDAHVEFAAANWDKIDPTRQWQLESPEAIQATGYHIKLTHMSIGGAHSWYESITGKKLDPAHNIPESEFVRDEERGFSWAPVA